MTEKILSFWDKAREKAQQKEIIHSIHMTRVNPDYKKAHPQECRDNPTCKKEAHPEAVKRIVKELKLKTDGAFQPTVLRPARLNR